MMKNISKLKNHFVICGYGRMGAVIARELQQKNLEFVIIELNDKKVDKATVLAMLSDIFLGE